MRRLDILVKAEGKVSKASKMGLCDKVANRMLSRLGKQAALQDPSFHDYRGPIPDPYIASGVSQYIDKEGKLGGRWVKSALDKTQVAELVREMIVAFGEDIPRAPAIKKIKPNNELDDELVNLFTLTDYHLGMFAWAEETGEREWNIEIAEKVLYQWVDEAVARCPKAGTAVYLNLGDFLHYDSTKGVTPNHGHVLDVSGRMPQLVRASIRAQRAIISRLLEHHNFVHLVFADANHDPLGQIWSREHFAAHYENDSRVTVDTDPSPYGAYEFGEVLLCWHHGHIRKEVELSKVFAGKFREAFGRTKFAYGHTGHRHSSEVYEDNLMIIERHRTLAPADAYSSGLGYKPGSDAQVITYHASRGEVSRLRIAFQENP